MPLSPIIGKQRPAFVRSLVRCIYTLALSPLFLIFCQKPRC